MWAVFDDEYVSVPPVNAAVLSPACRVQQTLPEWKVSLLAEMETEETFIPAEEKSNFQLTFPEEEPSVRAKYTWGEKYNQSSHLEDDPGSEKILVS